MKRHARLVPCSGDSEAVGGVTEKAVELHRHDGLHLLALHEREHARAALAGREPLARRYARIDDELHELEPAQRAIGPHLGFLRLQGDALVRLLLGTDTDVGDGADHVVPLVSVVNNSHLERWRQRESSRGVPRVTAGALKDGFSGGGLVDPIAPP